MARSLALVLLLLSQSGYAFNTFEMMSGGQVQKWDGESEQRVGTSLRSKMTFFNSSFGWVSGVTLRGVFTRLDLGGGWRTSGNTYFEIDGFYSHDLAEGGEPVVAIGGGQLSGSYLVSIFLNFRMLTQNPEFGPTFGVKF